MEMNPEIRAIYREISPGVFWLPNCLARAEPAGWMHIHAGCYLIIGPTQTMMVDTGHPAHWDAISSTLEALLSGRPLDFVFPTHTEIPHAGNLERLLTKYPQAIALGDMRDFHLYYPSVADRFRAQTEGDVLSLGGKWDFHFTEAVIRDLPNTLWGFLDPAAVLFVSDGFMLSHHATEDGDEALHTPEECLLMASELSWPLELSQVTFVTERSIYWMRYANSGESLRRMSEAIADHGTRLIAPTHSNVVDDPEKVLGLMDEAWTAIARGSKPS
jgi:hypothetical protein